MEIEEAIRTYLLTKSALAALISTRILPDGLSDSVDLPAGSFQRITDYKEHYFTGQSTTESPIFQYTVYASTKAGAVTIKNHLKSALNDYQGTLSGLVVQKIELQNEMSGKEVSSDGSIKIHTEDLEYQVTFERS